MQMRPAFRGSPISVGKNFPTEILLISAEFFSENGLFHGNGWEFRGDQEISGEMCLVYNEGCDQGDGCSTRDPLQYLDLHKRVSGVCGRERLCIRMITCYSNLLRCFVVIAVIAVCRLSFLNMWQIMS